MSIKIGNLDISYFKVGSGDCSIYLGDTLMYPTTPPTPTGSTCYEVINDPITAYTATTYDSVYSFADSKWYMKNNLNQYEEYGIYDTANTLSDLTYYDGKLAVIGTTEYQYSGGTWVNVGTYITTEVSYDIPTGYSTTYQGQTIPTTFKISVADMNVLNKNNISIYDNTKTSYYLRIGKTSYLYYGSPRITGTVTSDSDYYYFTLTDAKPSIEIYRTRGYNGTVHIITGEESVTVEYPEKDIPLAKAYQSVAAMETEMCPTVGVGQYGVVGSDVYQFDSTELWVTAGDHYKVLEKSNNVANIVWSDSSSSLTSGDTKPKYFNYSDITEVIIGNYITSIGNGVFSGCTSLASIVIPSGVTSIGTYAFAYCSALPSIDIPSGVTSIGNRVFNGCSSLGGIDIPSGVTSIGTYAFAGCSALPSIDIPSGVTSIGEYAFRDCSMLTSCTIGSGVTSIANGLFSSCNSLISVTIPNSVTSIGQFAFNGNGLTSIGSVGSGTSIEIPSSITSISGLAFADCSSLTSATIPNNVTNIGEGIFRNCVSLSNITVDGNNTKYNSRDNCNAIIETSANILIQGCKNTIIPNSVTSIGASAFQGCSFTNIIMPSSIRSIGTNAFRVCRNLTDITIPNSVTSIGNYAFYNCSSLTSCTLGSGVTSIGEYAFVFCSSLTSVTVLATTPPTLGNNAFDTSTYPIYVPASAVNTYKSATNWSSYASRIQAIPNS